MESKPENMIRLFKKVRQKLLSKNSYSLYILYASGEILLVIVGIIIAHRSIIGMRPGRNQTLNFSSIPIYWMI